MNRANFGNLTNNKLESLNARVKELLEKNNSIVYFFNLYFTWIATIIRESKNKISKNFTKSKRNLVDNTVFNTIST